MRYYVRIGDREHALDVTARPSGGFDVAASGKAISADVVAIGRVLSMIVDGHVLDLSVEGNVPNLGVVASGKRVYLHVESERMRAAARANKKNLGGGEGLVVSPMPGRVLKVLVEVGASVVVGTPLVVVEAMKMENELRATKAGIVEKVHVRTGDTVESGQKLILIA